MLEKNEYPVKFNDKENKKLKETIGNKQVVTFQLVNSLSRVDKATGKRFFKRRHMIEAAYVGFDDEGNTEEFRYFRNKRQQGKGANVEIIYSPEFLVFENGGKLKINLGEGQNENKDLLTFLLNHPRRAYNKNGDGSRRPLFYLVDRNIEAQEYAQIKRAAADMDKYLWSEDQIDEDDARMMAKALRIEGVDEMNDAATRRSIEDSCKKNPQRFLNLLKQTDDTKLRALIQEASERSILKFDTKKLEWSMYDSESNNEAKLTRVRSTDDPTSSLVIYFKTEDDNGNVDRVRELVELDKKKK